MIRPAYPANVTDTDGGEMEMMLRCLWVDVLWTATYMVELIYR